MPTECGPPQLLRHLFTVSLLIGEPAYDAARLEHVKVVFARDLCWPRRWLPCPAPARARLSPSGRRMRHSGSHRRLNGVALTPCTTIEAITHAAVVQNTVLASASLSTPAPMATAT